LPVGRLNVLSFPAEGKEVLICLGSNDVHPSVIQTVLRYTRQKTTSRYIHSVNDKQLEAQGLNLDAIKNPQKSPPTFGQAPTSG